MNINKRVVGISYDDRQDLIKITTNPITAKVVAVCDSQLSGWPYTSRVVILDTDGTPCDALASLSAEESSQLPKVASAIYFGEE